MAETVALVVPIEDLSERQLLLEIFRRQDIILETLTRMEIRMSDLSASVDDLKAAVDGVAQRLLPKIRDLEASLEDTKNQLSTALEDDEQAAQVLAGAQQAAADIREEIGRLNALGQDPSTPVDPDPTDPVEPPPVEVDPDPDAPHPDNTLPGDLPS